MGNMKFLLPNKTDDNQKQLSQGKKCGYDKSMEVLPKDKYNLLGVFTTKLILSCQLFAHSMAPLLINAIHTSQEKIQENYYLQ